MLVGEKRQRLLVEEQTQDLADQHAKVIVTLEQRLRKQEKQIQDLTKALTTPHNANSVGDAFDNAKGLTTPRSLTRGALSARTQHRRSLNDEKSTEDVEKQQADSPALSPSVGSAASGAADQPAPAPRVVKVVELSSEAARPSESQQNPIVAHSNRPPLQLQSTLEDSSSKQARLAADDVANFLESISKELESISEGETQRRAKLSAF
jgi:hypothetical protein